MAGHLCLLISYSLEDSIRREEHIMIVCNAEE